LQFGDIQALVMYALDGKLAGRIPILASFLEQLPKMSSPSPDTSTSITDLIGGLPYRKALTGG
jgi:hypothetical protein